MKKATTLMKMKNIIVLMALLPSIAMAATKSETGRRASVLTRLNFCSLISSDVIIMADEVVEKIFFITSCVNILNKAKEVSISNEKIREVIRKGREEMREVVLTELKSCALMLSSINGADEVREAMFYTTSCKNTFNNTQKLNVSNEEIFEVIRKAKKSYLAK